MDAPLEKNHDKNIFILGGFLLICVIALFLVNVLVNTFGTKSPPPARTQNTLKRVSPDNKTNTQVSVPRSDAVVPAPEIKFEAYDLKTQLPATPDNLKVYKLKSNYTVEEATQFAAQFSLGNPQISADRKFVTFSNFNDPDDRGILSFDLATGRFFFNSYGDHRAAISLPNQSPLLTATLFLQSLGYGDTITCIDSYKRKQEADNIYVECHHDWQKTGLPIINPLGTLNIDETTKLSSLELGKPDSQAPADPAVIETTNKADGKARSNDFNTATFAISQSSGRIISLDSNLRKLETTTEITSNNEIISPQQALSNLTNNRSLFTFTLPTGQGYVPWEKIYADNRASGKKATVLDVALSYLEFPEGIVQDNLIPVYIVRGTAELTNGYKVKFVEALPTTNRRFALVTTAAEVAGESTIAQLNDRTPKQGTFDFGTTTPTVEPTTFIPTPSLPVPTTTPSQCVPFTGSSEIKVNIPGLGTIDIYYNSSNAYDAREIYYKSASFPFAEMDRLREIFFAGSGDELGPVGQQYLISVAKELTNPNSFALRPTVTPPRTIEDAKKLFAMINRAAGPGPYGRMQLGTEFCGASLQHARIAPPVPEDMNGCTIDTKNYMNLEFVNKLIKPMTDKVAAKLVESVQNNSLQTLASQSNIFPDAITSDFQQIVYAPYGSVRDIYDQHNQSAFTCRITGSSPRIFVYGANQNMTIQPQAPITFADPPLRNKTWNVERITNNELAMGNMLHSSLYYEYDRNKVALDIDKNGYIIEKADLESFVTQTIAPQIKLNEQEANALIIDIKNELWNVDNYKYIVLRPITEESLNQNLPLHINLQPNIIRRVHFSVHPTNNYVVIQEPKLKQIMRHEITLVEIGARLTP